MLGAIIIYRIQKFSLDKISPSAATCVLQKNLVEKIFTNAVKVAISFTQSLVQDKKLALAESNGRLPHLS
jgi:hypothetical protein